MLKALRNLLKRSKWVLNQRGIAPWVIPTAITAGGALMKQFGKKDEKQEPQWFVDPWTQKLRDIQAPKMDPGYYDIPQPGVEAATEKALIPRIGRGVADIKPTLGPEAAQKYYAAEKERRTEGFGEEQTFLKDIMQKEGVLTSTPGMEAQMKLKRQQQAEMGAFGEKLMYEDIQRDIQATQMAENIIASSLSQGMTLGGQQTERLKWPYAMAQGAFSQAQGLGSMGYMPEQEPSMMEELGGAGMDIGKMMLLMNMFKGGAGTKGGTQSKDGGFTKLPPDYLTSGR